MTFLFINAEAWEMTSRLPFGRLWGGVAPPGPGPVFLLVRHARVDQADDAVDDNLLTRARVGVRRWSNPSPPARRPRRRPGGSAGPRLGRWNLIALLIIQTAQVLVLVVAVSSSAVRGR